MSRTDWPSHEEAFLHYLELGEARSLGKLAKSYEGKYDPVPTVSTLKQWSKAGNWQIRAKEHDIQTAALVMTRVTEETAEGHLDMAKAMHSVAYQLMGKALRMASKAKDGNVQDAAVVADIGLKISKQALDTERGRPPSAERLAELMKTIGVDPASTKVTAMPGAAEPAGPAKPSILRQFEAITGGKGQGEAS